MVSCIQLVPILLFFIPSAAPLSFSFTNFTLEDHDINYEHSAFAANTVIQLTGLQRDHATQANIGRATYATPLHLWDRDSGNLSDFMTNFTFLVNSQRSNSPGDGIAFFLAPNGSRIPDTNSLGGTLGLTTDGSVWNSTDNPFLAVEFDPFTNDWDPGFEHVGIDINSVESVTNSRWSSFFNITEGMQHQAWISYDSRTKNLSVVFTVYTTNRSYTAGLSYAVDLRQHLPEFVTFGFSGATGSNMTVLNTIYSWSFSSNLDINGVKSGKSNTGLVVGLAVGAPVVLLLVLFMIVYFYWWKRKGKHNEDDESETVAVSINDEFEQGTGPKKFAYNDLKRATNNFAQQEKLGEGGFGGVYKGFVKGIDSFVAVKRVGRDSSQGIKEFASEVRIISRLRHRNLVQLLGWCHEKLELLLVYELMPNGSLDYHLFKGKSLLDWRTRFKIAQGLASALLYLHEEWEQCVVHRDIKSSNVMLDASFNAKLGDFGLARLVDHDKAFQTTVVAGTLGYMAPESISSGKASKETDVFSFGVVALEIASGRRSIDRRAAQSRLNLVEWATNLYGTGNLLDAADPKLDNQINAREVEQLMIVGLWCTIPDSSLRPSIRQAILVLNFEAPLPVLPLRTYVPSSSSRPVDMVPSPFRTETTITGGNQIMSSDITKSSRSTVSLGSLVSSE